AIADERVFVGWLGCGLVEEAWPARAAALFASCRHEACPGKNAEVQADGVHVQADLSCEFGCVEGRVSLLQDLENPDTAWVAEGAVECCAVLCGLLARRSCHDQIVTGE